MISPIGDRVVIEVVEEDTLTLSGIIIPDMAKNKPQKGTVVAKGKGKIDESGYLRPIDVEVGDEVLYSRYGGTEVIVDSTEYLVLRESDILAKVG